MLSGIQHFLFCRRQWALIHLENQWEENIKTIEGSIVHEKCHDNELVEVRKDLLIIRGLYIQSYTLGISGQCDVLEFRRRKDNAGAVLSLREGTWDICPIEYKKGKPKKGLEDIAQLCGQAMCLEETFGVTIKEGYLYYASIRRREKVVFDEEIKNKIRDSIKEMHEVYRRGHTPIVKTSSKCRWCSLKDICMPTLMKKKDVGSYYSTYLED